MDLSQYAELFLAESREHLSACNQLLLEWERNPAALQPVGGLFRAVHTIKGMAVANGRGHALDRMDGAEQPADRLERCRVPLPLEQQLISGAQVLAALGQEQLGVLRK